MLKKLGELFRYGFVGALCTAINLLLFVLFLHLKMHYLFANSISYFIAVICNYFLSGLVVFVTDAGKPSRNWSEFLKFLGIRLCSLGADSALLYLTIDVLHFNAVVAKVTVSALLIIVTFFFMKKFVFRNSESER